MVKAGDTYARGIESRGCDLSGYGYEAAPAATEAAQRAAALPAVPDERGFLRAVGVVTALLARQEGTGQTPAVGSAGPAV